ncbi:hypothetical protein EJ06DRAFT_553544 [Trichodelitschia bisporula]|uniref:Uncharacterized protein n=1 Tax=Trichodelitschia bisporula TaxID=703511 RepID=A0A6G1I937_9PEZI|nr:hypothetical protein EJ06DRAFT_553544 [Trichodelitschia bisporula]
MGLSTAQLENRFVLLDRIALPGILASPNEATGRPQLKVHEGLQPLDWPVWSAYVRYELDVFNMWEYLSTIKKDEVALFQGSNKERQLDRRLKLWLASKCTPTAMLEIEGFAEQVPENRNSFTSKVKAGWIGSAPHWWKMAELWAESHKAEIQAESVKEEKSGPKGVEGEKGRLKEDSTGERTEESVGDDTKGSSKVKSPETLRAEAWRARYGLPY